MQKSYERLKKTARYSNRTQREKNSPNTYMAIRSCYLIPPACLFGLSIDCRHKSGNRLVTAIYSDSRNEKFDAARRNKSATQLRKVHFLYPQEFTGDSRSVFLLGEANFKVKPDKKRPFIVKSMIYRLLR